MAHAEGCPVGCGDPHQRDAWVGGGLDYLGQGELNVDGVEPEFWLPANGSFVCFKVCNGM